MEGNSMTFSTVSRTNRRDRALKRSVISSMNFGGGNARIGRSHRFLKRDVSFVCPRARCIAFFGLGPGKNGKSPCLRGLCQ